MTDETIALYRELTKLSQVPRVLLMLDGFQYEKIDNGIRIFNGLATSQGVNLSSQASMHARVFLHPFWKKDDIFEMATVVFRDESEVVEDKLEDRYYYAGGSVREFCRKYDDMIDFANKL